MKANSVHIALRVAALAPFRAQRLEGLGGYSALCHFDGMSDWLVGN